MFCFRETDSQKRKGNGRSSKGRCPFRKNQGLQFVTVLFLQVSWCFVLFACGRSLASIDQQHGAVSRVTVGGFLSHPGSFVASYQSAMGPGPKVKSYLWVQTWRKQWTVSPHGLERNRSQEWCVFWMCYDMTTIVVTRDHQFVICRSCTTCGHSEAVCGVSQSGTTCLVNYDECRPRVL